MAAKKRKGSGGKRKGNAFERAIMNKIVKTFSPFGITVTDAFRSILSGGHKDSCGDISFSPALIKMFPFSIECKFYKKIDMYNLLVPWEKMGKSNKFKMWWNQTLEGAKKNPKLAPLLVFKSNNNEIMCMAYYGNLSMVSTSTLSASRVPYIIVQQPDATRGDIICFRFSYLLHQYKKREASQCAKTATSRRKK